MPEENPPARVPEGRVSTGNAGLDAMLEGGLVPHRPYLVVGPAGTGKSRLALQFLCEGVRRGERSLLVTLEEPPNEARINHRGLAPELESVDVFDAIPDVMRYERTPFKDIASVRSAVAFRRVPFEIRRTPELTSVEVTITALEQMLRSEVLRKNYTRLVIDSLTALQYFCMKGFDPIAGAQTFLRFLSDLQVTTILTVESPLEDADTPERMLARGEIRLFRWELEEQTVRAIGVEKFRGSPHDVRLHPYRIGPSGLDINLRATISRDTRKIVEPEAPALPAAEPPALALEPLEEAVQDLVAVGADLGALRTEVESALAATTAGDPDGAQLHLTGAWALTVSMAQSLRDRSGPANASSPGGAEALRRILGRSDSMRVGAPPGRLPMPPVLAAQLARVLASIPPSPVPPAAPAGPPVSAAAPSAVGPPAPTIEPSPAAAPTPTPETPLSVAPAPTAPEAPIPEKEVGPATPVPAPAPTPAVPPSRAPPAESRPSPSAPSPSPPAPASRTSAPKRESVPSVAEFLAPHSHLNPEPPPLPSRLSSGSKGSPPPSPAAARTPGQGAASPPTPAVPRDTSAGAVGGRSPRGGPAHGSSSPPPDLPKLSGEPGSGPAPAAPVPPGAEAPAPKRRKKAAAPKKKASPSKSSAPTTERAGASGVSPASHPLATAPPPHPSAVPDEASAEAAAATPVAPPSGSAPVAGSPEPAAPPIPEPAKPKRRSPRKKKAPPVVAAEPGEPPADRSEPPSAPAEGSTAPPAVNPEAPKEAR